jgi:hypothetical protein
VGRSTSGQMSKSRRKEQTSKATMEHCLCCLYLTFTALHHHSSPLSLHVIQMNWTGGSLQRSKAANNKGIVKKQKAHFARARAHLHQGFKTPASPFSIHRFGIQGDDKENKVSFSSPWHPVSFPSPVYLDTEAGRDRANLDRTPSHSRTAHIPTRTPSGEFAARVPPIRNHMTGKLTDVFPRALGDKEENTRV